MAIEEDEPFDRAWALACVDRAEEWARKALTEIWRWSSRQGRKHALHGWEGSAEYSGAVLAEFEPLMRVAQLVGIGKATSFGHGRVTFEPGSDADGRNGKASRQVLARASLSKALLEDRNQ